MSTGIHLNHGGRVVPLRLVIAALILLAVAIAAAVDPPPAPWVFGLLAAIGYFLALWAPKGLHDE